MLLKDLAKSTGLNKKSKRLGRGDSSGRGNYSTKGQKGQNSRSGGGMPAWFEGGQTPLTQRLPKLRGFKRYFKLVKDVEVINLDVLEADERIKSGDKITKSKLVELNYIKNESVQVKVLGRGDISKKLEFVDIKLSKSAEEKSKSPSDKVVAKRVSKIVKEKKEPKVAVKKAVTKKVAVKAPKAEKETVEKVEKKVTKKTVAAKKTTKKATKKTAK